MAGYRSTHLDHKVIHVPLSSGASSYSMVYTHAEEGSCRKLYTHDIMNGGDPATVEAV